MILAVGCQDRSEVVVFHAASLAQVLKKVSDAFVSAHPQYSVRLEVSGSQTAARKVAELKMRADVVAVADAAVIDRILVPEHAAWNLHFSANEIVLAHQAHSRHTDAITSANWTRILLEPGVRLGCVDPDLAPIGYRTRHVWQLAGMQQARETGQAQLDQRLSERCAREHVMPDEGKLVALLAARAVDYIFVYRSTAHEQRLKLTALPESMNLGSKALASEYARAAVEVQMSREAPKVRMLGAPILYGLTVPHAAPNPAGARQFIDFLLAQPGQKILRRSGFSPLPAADRQGAGVPPEFSKTR